MVGQFTPAFEAATDIRPFRFVNINTTGVDNTVDEANLADEQVVGISEGSNKAFDSANHAESGDPVSLQPGTILRVEATEALDAGDLLGPDNDGKAQTYIASDGLYAFARALEDASGDGIIIRCLWLGAVNLSTT